MESLGVVCADIVIGKARGDFMIDAITSDSYRLDITYCVLGDKVLIIDEQQIACSRG
jgi:hypothetical protein